MGIQFYADGIHYIPPDGNLLDNTDNTRHYCSVPQDQN